MGYRLVVAVAALSLVAVGNVSGKNLHKIMNL